MCPAGLPFIQLNFDLTEFSKWQSFLVCLCLFPLWVLSALFSLMSLWKRNIELAVRFFWGLTFKTIQNIFEIQLSLHRSAYVTLFIFHFVLLEQPPLCSWMTLSWLDACSVWSYLIWVMFHILIVYWFLFYSGLESFQFMSQLFSVL